MAKLSDDELTKLAVDELLRDAKRFKNQRDAEFRATQMKRPMQTNKPFLKNTLRDILSFNKKKADQSHENTTRNHNVETGNKIRKLKNKDMSHKFIIKFKTSYGKQADSTNKNVENTIPMNINSIDTNKNSVDKN